MDYVYELLYMYETESKVQRDKNMYKSRLHDLQRMLTCRKNNKFRINNVFNAEKCRNSHVSHIHWIEDKFYIK